MPASPELADQRPAAGQADLSAMRMPAKIECIARFICVVGNLRGVHEGDTELAGVVVGQRRPRGFGIETVDVIEPRDAQAVTVTPQHERAIDQDLEARSFERIDHRERIVIAKHGHAVTSHADAVERLCQQPDRTGDRRSMVSVHVPCHGEHVDFKTSEQLSGNVCDRRERVEMRVADMQYPVAIELPRQLWKGELEFAQLEIEGVQPAASMKRREAKARAECGQKAGEQPLAPTAAPAGGAAPISAVFHAEPLGSPFWRGVIRGGA